MSVTFLSPSILLFVSSSYFILQHMFMYMGLFVLVLCNSKIVAVLLAQYVIFKRLLVGFCPFSRFCQRIIWSKEDLTCLYCIFQSKSVGCFHSKSFMFPRWYNRLLLWVIWNTCIIIVHINPSYVIRHFTPCITLI